MNEESHDPKTALTKKAVNLKESNINKSHSIGKYHYKADIIRDRKPLMDIL
ncbi:MAG: hypothetical protein IPN67_15735 [Bacteroidales bacterium]|nr:hypothetical protein [Bacteroidales bacterium]MBK8883767.1 hypothetical protein [Bacteroidales bacterium]